MTTDGDPHFDPDAELPTGVSEVPQATPAPTAAKVVEADALYLRESPAGPARQTLAKGTSVVVNGEKTVDGVKWLQVRAGDAEGWCRAQYLS